VGSEGVQGKSWRKKRNVFTLEDVT
jgi:hypothetical protein